VAVTEQTLGKNIIITYQGGPDADKLLYSTASVNGVERSEKLGTTPGDTITLEGIATSGDHVVIVGHFNDGSTQTILDDKNSPDTSGGIYYRTVPTPDRRFSQPAYTVQFTINPARYY
jgi:hypothetical protein